MLVSTGLARFLRGAALGIGWGIGGCGWVVLRQGSAGWVGCGLGGVAA